MTLEPVGPGQPVYGTCVTDFSSVAGLSYDDEVTVTCTFEDVPVNTYTVEAIADGILAVLEDNEKAARMRQMGLRRASLFTWERTARQTLTVYERISEPGGAVG